MAIKESIEIEMMNKKGKLVVGKTEENGIEDEADSIEVDPVPEITARHFEIAMKFARKSVTEGDIRKYETFSKNLQHSRGFGNFR